MVCVMVVVGCVVVVVVVLVVVIGCVMPQLLMLSLQVELIKCKFFCSFVLI